MFPSRRRVERVVPDALHGAVHAAPRSVTQAGIPVRLQHPPESRRPAPHLSKASGPEPAKSAARRAVPRAAVHQPVPAMPPWDPATYHVPPLPGQTRFQNLGFAEPLIHAIADLGFQYCTPIQALSLPPALAGKDVAGQAQTGTGKTAAFLWTMFTRFLATPAAADRSKGTPRALILAPTRELVIQIYKDAAALGRYCPFTCMAVYGGLGYDAQRDQLSNQLIDVVAATPGRLLDFVRKNVIDLSRVEILVLDEADRMLDMGFIPDIRRIMAHLPRREQRQTMLFSATLSAEILRLASQWMRDPVAVKAEAEPVAPASIEQVVYLVRSEDKPILLLNLLQRPEMKRVLVFVNRRDMALRLTTRLQKHQVNCDLLSGDVAQGRRLKILEGFRSGQIRVLVATDVAGRGLHIAHISHVVNYDVPVEPQDYVHRIGRTGRAGAIGTALTFACERESFTLPEIEKLIGNPLSYRQPDDVLLRRPPPPDHRDGERKPPHGERTRDPAPAGE